MLHVVPVCTPCCMLLRVVGSCCAKFETGQTFRYVKTDATNPNNVGSCWPTMLHWANLTWKVAWPWQILSSFSFLCFFWGVGGWGKTTFNSVFSSWWRPWRVSCPVEFIFSFLYVSLFVILKRKKEPKEIFSCLILKTPTGWICLATWNLRESPGLRYSQILQCMCISFSWKEYLNFGKMLPSRTIYQLKTVKVTG